MQALRSRHVSSASKCPEAIITHRSNRPSVAALQSSVLALWINQGTQWFYGEPLETSQICCGLPRISTHDSAPTSSWLDLGFEAQPRNCPRLHLAVLSTTRPALDPSGHRVPRTKPTCLSTHGGLTDIDLSCLFFTCTSTNQVAACTCNTRPRVNPQNVVNHSSYQEATNQRSSNHIGS
jgi:hypothetical protein